MATLEKIRNKSVLLFIIIIVALLAFILGDFLTSGRTYFGHPTTVAEANGVTVEYQDYQNRISQTSEQMRNQGREVSNDVLSQNVVTGLLTEQLLNKEYADLGITVTDQELSDALVGDTPHPAAYQMIGYLAQQLQLPEASGRVVFDAMQNPAKYNLPTQVGAELRQIWANQEKELENTMKQQKFMSLISGLFTFNKLDAKNFYDDNATTRTIAYAVKDVAAVADNDIEFSDADVKALWESQKQNYELGEPMKEVNYIYVAIEPSQADRLAGQQAVENAIVALNQTPGTEGVASDTHFSVQNLKNTASAVKNTKLREFITTKEPGTAELINRQGDSYTIAKLQDVTTGIDSINISMLNAPASVNADSIATLINNGTSFGSLAETYAAQDSIWTPLENIGIDEKTKSALLNAAIGKAFVLNDTIQGNAVQNIFRVNRRHAPVKYYDYAVIDYTVDPSQETLTDLSTNLRTYVSNNSSANDFTDNAGAAGYSVLSDQVGASSTGIGNARDSRRFVKWAMENNKGKVSPVMQDDRQSYLIALAVMDSYDDYMPWTSPAVANQLRNQALDSKKADKLLADYAGKANDLKGYATLFEARLDTGNVNITTPTLLNIGINESALQGAIAAADKGQFVGPVKGNHGIMVFEVEEVDQQNRPFVEADYGQRFIQTFGIGRRGTPLPLLLGKNKIDNRSLNFVQAVGE